MFRRLHRLRYRPRQETRSGTYTQHFTTKRNRDFRNYLLTPFFPRATVKNCGTMAQRCQCQGNIKIFGKICASIHLLIHKLLLSKITITRTVKETITVYFPGARRNNLRNVSLTLFCRVRDANGRFPFITRDILTESPSYFGFVSISSCYLIY